MTHPCDSGLASDSREVSCVMCPGFSVDRRLGTVLCWTVSDKEEFMTWLVNLLRPLGCMGTQVTDSSKPLAEEQSHRAKAWPGNVTK